MSIISTGSFLALFAIHDRTRLTLRTRLTYITKVYTVIIFAIRTILTKYGRCGTFQTIANWGMSGTSVIILNTVRTQPNTARKSSPKIPTGQL